MNFKSFLQNYGSDTTSNFYLRDICIDLNIKCKIIMRDEIKNYLNVDNIILNLQTILENESHWVLCSKKYKIYFDSYGISPVKEIDEYMSSTYQYNTLQVQDPETKICGQLCVFVLYKLINCETFENIILNLYNDSNNTN